MFLKECTAAKARRNTLLKHRLAAYSQTVLQSVVAAEAVDYDRNMRGILYLHRSRRALEAGVEHMKLLESDGQMIKVSTATRWSRSSRAGPRPGADRRRDPLPDRRDGDCAKFTRALAARIIARGGEVVTGATVVGLASDGGRVARALTDRGPFAGDAYVLALGADSPRLARTLGVRLPIYPIKGYSLTIPVGASRVATDGPVRRRAQSRRRFALRRSSAGHRNRRIRRL